jgi:hypothetical protein
MGVTKSRMSIGTGLTRTACIERKKYCITDSERFVLHFRANTSDETGAFVAKDGREVDHGQQSLLQHDVGMT